jgi:hypothetical protein
MPTESMAISRSFAHWIIQLSRIIVISHRSAVEDGIRQGNQNWTFWKLRR